ncbi:MAG: TonB-dependent receptor [Porticoccaceae bacterium]
MIHVKSYVIPSIFGLITSMTLFSGVASVEAAEPLVLEEIIISAQKREQSLQDVPISVNAVSGQKMSDAGISNLEMLSSYVPNFSMNQTGIASVISIRGISSGINEGLEQSAGMYSDGIYYGRGPLSRVPMMDMERVEVVRGPQSILFGKNSIAGAVSMITAKPTDEFEGSITALYEPKHGEQDYRLVLSGPLTDTLRGRLAVLYRELDGYMQNDFNGNDEKNEEETVIRGSLAWDVTDQLTVNFKAENAQFDVRGRNIEVADNITLPSGGIGHLTSLNNVQTMLGRPLVGTQIDYHRDAEQDESNNEVENYTLDIEYQLGENTLNFTSAWVQYDTDEICDCDFTGAKVLLVDPRQEQFEQFSQEIRLTSPLGGTFEYIAGAFYQTYDLDYDEGIFIPTDGIVPILFDGLLTNTFGRPDAAEALAGSRAKRKYTQDSDLWAAFAQVSWNINDALKLTLGGRFSQEDKDGSRRQYHVTNTGVDVGSSDIDLNVAYNLFAIEPYDTVKGDRSESTFTPLVNIEWHASDTAMFYATWTKGHKSGGFDARSNASPDPANAPPGTFQPLVGSFEFEEEEAKSIEIGTKLTLLDGAAEVNIALFRTDYTDLQTSQFDGVLGFNVTNAGEARIQGVEADGRWLVAEGLTLSGSMAYLDFNFEDFPNSQCYFGEAELEPARVVGGGLCDASGSRREYTPEWKASVAADYERTIFNSLTLRTTVDVNFTDDYLWNATLDPRNEQEAHTIINARLAITDAADKWELAVIGRNLTDKKVINYGGNTPLAGGLTGGTGNSYYQFVGREKSVAMQLTRRF